MRNSERWIAGALFIIALLAFFFPLASLQLPVVGNIDVSGYDYLFKSKQFEDRVENLKSRFPEPSSSEIPSGFANGGQTASIQPLPVSVETLPLLKVEIFGSFALVGGCPGCS
jgi:hypothetical protein